MRAARAPPASLCPRAHAPAAAAPPSSFNKRQEEFASLREYNDYLEEVEDISAWRAPRCAARRARSRRAPCAAVCAVFNLCNRIDVPANEAKIAAYQAANADSITANRVKRVRRRGREPSSARRTKPRLPASLVCVAHTGPDARRD